MRVLLFSMPDSFEHTAAVAIRMPNGALASLAGNVDGHHDVAIADLVLVQRQARETARRLLREHRPEVVGLSVMTFQRKSAFALARLVREEAPAAALVAGGYDPSLAPEAWLDSPVDFVVRGEGEATFRELLRALERHPPAPRDGLDNALGAIAGLWWRGPQGWSRNPGRTVARLAESPLALPRRAARVLPGYTFLGRPVDVVETSRGCTFDCSFCSIIELRGRNFHAFPLARVIADIRDAEGRGARSVFLVDDNITLDLPRFRALCQAIVEAGLHHVEYLVQAMTSAIAAGGDPLAADMRRAGIRYVFLGIENVREEDLAFLRARSKNTQRGAGKARPSAALLAIDTLHRHGLSVVGGLIVGSPDDTREAIEANLEFARRHVDWPYIQHPTPYPGTPLRRELAAGGLIASEAVEEYDGTTSVVHNRHLEGEEIEFLRWRAERWMKLAHLPRVLLRRPLFVLRQGGAMAAHTLRGCTWRTLLGLEDEREAFRRYRRLREVERVYFGVEPGPAPAIAAAVGAPAAG